MKRSLILLMALLLTTPALAVVTITCTDEGSGVVRIDYDRGAEPAKVRAFALDVSIDSNCAVIASVTNYSGGEGDKYGIYPGNINLDDLNSPVWGSPVAPANDPGAEGTGVGTSRVILEMGSLYDMNSLLGPPDTGMLCKLNLTPPNACTGVCHVSIVVENTRGGVVLENGATAGISAPGCNVQFGPPMPTCWDDSQCYGDATGDHIVNTSDWPAVRDSWLKVYPDVDYDPCGDFNRDGTVNTSDWPAMRDNWLDPVPPGGQPLCSIGGTWPPQTCP